MKVYCKYRKVCGSPCSVMCSKEKERNTVLFLKVLIVFPLNKSLALWTLKCEAFLRIRSWSSSQVLVWSTCGGSCSLPFFEYPYWRRSRAEWVVIPWHQFPSSPHLCFLTIFPTEGSSCMSVCQMVLVYTTPEVQLFKYPLFLSLNEKLVD